MTIRSFTRSAVAALVTALSLACDVAEPDPAGDDVLPREDPAKPPLLNTWKIFTSEVANVDTRGKQLGNVTLLSVELVEGAIDDDSLWVDHGELRATVSGVPRLGQQFIDSTWTFLVGSREVVAHLKTIETASAAGLWSPSPTDPKRKLDPDRLVYTFEYDFDDVWYETCGDDPVGGGRTVIYGGIVVDHETGDISPRANSLYLGCLEGAVGKAALWGYAPDSPTHPSVSLPAFNTATRIIRHDFCADGERHTEVGKEVALRDRWIHQSFAPQYNNASFTTEAVWEEGGGALCLNKIRATGEILTSPYECPDGSVIPLCPSFVSFGYEHQGYGHFWTKTEVVP